MKGDIESLYSISLPLHFSLGACTSSDSTQTLSFGAFIVLLPDEEHRVVCEFELVNVLYVLKCDL